MLPDVVNQWEATLTFAAPGVTVLVSAAWLLAGDALRRRKLEAGVHRARQQRDTIMSDPTSSKALQAKACANYEELVSILHHINSCETRRVGVSLSDRLESKI